MNCNDRNIKEMLPVYQVEELEPQETKRVEAHLKSCADCRNELALLQIMAEEGVPDPGEAFWASLPGKVDREIDASRSKKKFFDLSRIADRLVLPRWAWAATAAAVVLLVSWLIITPLRTQDDDLYAWREAYDYGYGSMYDPALTQPSANMSDLSGTELDSVDAWAARELSTIASEAQSIMVNQVESDPFEEFADLAADEIEQLSILLNEYEEG